MPANGNCILRGRVQGASLSPNHQLIYGTSSDLLRTRPCSIQNVVGRHSVNPGPVLSPSRQTYNRFDTPARTCPLSTVQQFRHPSSFWLSTRLPGASCCRLMTLRFLPHILAPLVVSLMRPPCSGLLNRRKILISILFHQKLRNSLDD